MTNEPVAFSSEEDKQSQLAMSADEQALLDKHKEEYSGGPGFVDNTPTLKVDLNEGLNKGKYVLESSKRTENADKTISYEKVRELVKDPKIIILRKRYSYSYYDSTKNSLELWTNELDTFDASQPVVVFDKQKDLKKPEIMTYAEFKDAKLNRAEWVKVERGEARSLFTFVTVLYIVVDGIIAKFFVKMSSLIGQQADGTYDFKSPMPGSLKALEQEMGNIAPYTKDVVITPIAVEGDIPYYKHQFVLGTDTEIRTQIANRVALDKALVAIDNYRNRTVVSSPQEEAVPMPTEELPVINVDEPAQIADSNGDEVNLNDVFGS